MADDPIALFNRWYAKAQRAKAPLFDAMALATADGKGHPSVRFVLLKTADENGFVFYTNTESPKGRALARNPRAALAFYWDAIDRQVRVDGRVERVTDAEADAYWDTRPRLSRIGALVSRQSRPLRNYASFAAKVLALYGRYAGRRIPRPKNWTGFRVVPDSIEFWTRRLNRLHIRWQYRRTRRGWTRTLLQP
jgi:pyridoxamine 5'-phosphate oxidase